MATFTITGYTNIDQLTGKTAASDTYNINGGYLFVDQDSRVGMNQTTGSALGNITLSATLGGTIEFNATKVRLIQYDGGAGNVSGSNSSVWLGDASGQLIGVYSGLQFRAANSGAAMPATGYLKIKNWNGVAFGTGAATGIQANLIGPDRAGWIECVGVNSLACTVNRLNKFIASGDWFDLGTTTADFNTTYQIPSNGNLVYSPGVWTETNTGTNLFEFYPCAGTLPASGNRVQNDPIRGKVCWIDTTGKVWFGRDGANTGGGYVPPAGLKIRVPNIFFTTCAAATQASNVLPNATLATRYRWVTTSAGVVDINKAQVNWNAAFAQPYSVALKNVGIMTQLNASEIASPIAWEQIGVGQEAANTQNALVMATCFAGGYMSGCTWTRAALATAVTVNSITDCSDLVIQDEKTFAFLTRANASAGVNTLTRVNGSSWKNSVFGGGRVALATCSNISFSGITYFDCLTGTTSLFNPMYVFDMTLNCSNVTMDNIHFGGLPLVQPYAGILQLGAAGCSNIKLRNLGSYANPLDMGGPQKDLVPWSRASTHVVVTDYNHGLKPSDVIYVPVSQDTAAIAIGAKTVTGVISSNQFMIAGTNGGATTGRTLSYYPTMGAALFVLANGAAANTVSVQRCYTPHLRTNLYTADNSSKNVLVESAQGDYLNVPVFPELNGYNKGIFAVPSLAAQTSCYGTHWVDGFITHTPPNTVTQPWDRATTNITGLSTGHFMRTNDQIVVTETSHSGVVPLGLKTITGYTNNTFVFGGINTGPATGTFTYVPLNGRIGLVMNEATSETANQYTIDSGNPAFTSAGGLFMPTTGDQITFTTPNYVLNHSSFPIAEVRMAGGVLDNYNLSYALDKNNGQGFSPFYNLSYLYTGCTGFSGTFDCRVSGGLEFNTVATGDYIWGTGIAFNAKVSGVFGNQLTTDLPHIGVIGGNLKFNHLPFETGINPALGFKMKARFQTRANNLTAITSLYAFTNTTSGDRAYQYPLDTRSTALVINNLQTGTEVHVYRASDTVELSGIEQTAGSVFSYPYTWAGDDTESFITVIKTGYQWIRYDNQFLGSGGLTIPSFQLIDRNYSNQS